MAGKTFDDYAEDLKKLLAKAEAAVAAALRPQMTAAREGLVAFVESSNDLVPGVIELDEVASTARRDVTLALLGQGVGDIGSRSAEVSRAVKKFASQAGVNNSAAATLRLERTRALSDAALVMVAELKKFGDFADGGTVEGKKLAKALQAAIDAVTTVKEQVSG